MLIACELRISEPHGEYDTIFSYAVIIPDKPLWTDDAARIKSAAKDNRLILTNVSPAFTSDTSKSSASNSCTIHAAYFFLEPYLDL